jgi:hypothetical protein
MSFCAETVALLSIFVTKGILCYAKRKTYTTIYYIFHANNLIMNFLHNQEKKFVNEGKLMTLEEP